MTGTSPYELLRLTLPEVLVALSGLGALTVDLMLMRGRPLVSRWRVGAAISCVGCIVAIFLLLLHPAQANFYDGTLVVNSLTQLVQAVLVAFTILAVLLPVGSAFTNHIGEYLGVVLFATAAAMILAGTQNLLVIFAALELLSLSLYILTGFDKRSGQSAEAALKYFLFGGMAAAIFLFGISLLYGFSGTINLSGVLSAVQTRPGTPLLALAVVMIVAGLGFKIATAPFHLWAPDAYQGAPTSSAGFIASSSKIASFFLLAIVLWLGLGAEGLSGHLEWRPVIVAVAAFSMLLGNVAAIVQTSVRRLLAYSAIGHAGYMLLGILSDSKVGLSALLYYVITYALATLGAFGVLVALDEERIDRLSDFKGMSRRAPWLAFCMLIFLLSLAGIPPLAGFFGKFYIFSSALAGGGGLLWLVILAIGMSAVSLYYYLRVLKQIYVSDPVEEGPIRTPGGLQAVVGVIAFLVVLLGCFPNLLIGWIDNAVRAVPH